MTALFFLALCAMALGGVAMCVLARADRKLWEPDPGRSRATESLEQRRHEIRAELERGLVDEDGARRALAELEEAAGAKDEEGAAQSIAPRGVRAAKVAVALFVPLLAGALYLEVGDPQAALRGRAGPQPAGNSMQIDLEAAVERLKERVRAAPEDRTAFGLLFRTLMTLGRYAEAREVARGARAQNGDSADLLVMEADALAQTQGGRVSGTPRELAGRALELDPGHVEALWLSGLAAQEARDFSGAADFFARARQREEDPQKRAGLKELEDRARASAGADPETAAQADPAESPAGTAAAAGALHLHVEVAPELQPKIDPGRVVFVFAREPGGMSAPIAAARLSAGALPAAVMLDDSSSMLPGRLLSGFSEVEVVARISASGAPRASPGDLYGEMPATVGGGSVFTLTIDRRVP